MKSTDIRITQKPRKESAGHIHKRQGTKDMRKISQETPEKGRRTPRPKELVPTLTGTQPNKRRKDQKDPDTGERLRQDSPLGQG